MEEQESETCPDEIALAITRIAVAQICQRKGLTGAQQSALETLTDVATRYLRGLGNSAAAYATSCGRTQTNVFDIARALEDLNSAEGFRGAWDVNRPLLASQTLADLATFVRFSPEIPFAKPIPRRLRPPVEPVGSTNPVRSHKFLQQQQHIPTWLPTIREVASRKINGKETAAEEENSSNSGTVNVSSNAGGCSMMGSELPENRSRVRFKIIGVGREGTGSEVYGLDSRSGVCRGGKRVFCHNWADDNMIKTKVNKMGTFKRPR